MRHDQTGKNHVYHFENLLDLLDYVKQTPDGNRSKEPPRPDFTPDDWTTTTHKAIYGDPESADVIREIDDQMRQLETNDDQDFLPGIEYKKSGRSFNPARVIAGHPKPFRQLNFHNPARIINIFVSNNLSWITTPDEARRRGLAIAVLVNRLQREGNIINLRLVYGYDCRPDNVDRRIKKLTVFVKLDTQPLDLHQINFATANPCMLRRFIFAVMELCAKLPDCGSYGKIAQEKEVIDVIRQEFPEETFYYIPRMDHNHPPKNIEQAIKQVNESIENYEPQTTGAGA